MAGDARATAFVTGTAEIMRTELVKVLTARGHRVFGLTQSVAAADCVFHRPPHPEAEPRAIQRRTESVARARVLMDAPLPDAVAAGATLRVMYVADACCDGSTGQRSITEDEPPRPSRCDRSLCLRSRAFHE